MSLASEGKLQAPPGQYRVIGVDTFEAFDADYLLGDFTDQEEAIKVAQARGGDMNPTYVYDDQGRRIAGFGTP